MIITKICTKCKIEKELTDFHKDKKNKDGFSNRCKECAREYSKRYRKENKERLINNKKIYRKVNKDNLKQYNKSYYTQKRMERLEYQKNYQKENKDKVYNLNRIKQEKEKSLGTITKEQETVRFNFFNKSCCYCNSTNVKENYKDHIIPINDKGLNHITNTVTCCVSCNSKKRTKSLETFLKEYFTLEEQNQILEKIYQYKKYLQSLSF